MGLCGIHFQFYGILWYKKKLRLYKSILFQSFNLSKFQMRMFTNFYLFGGLLYTVWVCLKMRYTPIAMLYGKLWFSISIGWNGVLYTSIFTYIYCIHSYMLYLYFFYTYGSYGGFLKWGIPKSPWVSIPSSGPLGWRSPYQLASCHSLEAAVCSGWPRDVLEDYASGCIGIASGARTISLVTCIFYMI